MVKVVGWGLGEMSMSSNSSLTESHSFLPTGLRFGCQRLVYLLHHHVLILPVIYSTICAFSAFNRANEIFVQQQTADDPKNKTQTFKCTIEMLLRQ